MKNKFIKKIFKNICIVTFLIYVSISFIGQQQTLTSYASQQEYYIEKIHEAEAYNETLTATKENLNSKEYIETICREKLNMYSENEKVYISINK